jgi:two-component system response regulator YesN
VKEELTNTNKSIKEIAWSLGYQNYDNFLTSFKNHSGMTPLEYRDMTTGHKV